MTTTQIELKDFGPSDWDAFAGAERFEHGAQPLVWYGERTAVIVDQTGVFVAIYPAGTFRPEDTGNYVNDENEKTYLMAFGPDQCLDPTLRRAAARVIAEGVIVQEAQWLETTEWLEDRGFERIR